MDCPTGTFDYFFETGTFVWSEVMYRIHGYRRGDVMPSLELGMAHIAPGEQAKARSLWEQILTSTEPIAWYHTIIDARGSHRQVLGVVNAVQHDGKTTGIRGYLTDITASIHVDSHQRADDAVSRSAVRREVIEQAKGVLMALKGVSADEAFASISSFSQNHNRKVTDIAQAMLDVCAAPATLHALVDAIHPDRPAH
ncbi:PAS and ANTAR domain-containing protein [Arthrobacter sp. MDT1-48-3]